MFHTQDNKHDLMAILLTLQAGCNIFSCNLFGNYGTINIIDMYYNYLLYYLTVLLFEYICLLIVFFKL
jgi:hypothetical protein